MINLQCEEQKKAFLIYFDNEDSEHELSEMKELINSALLNFSGANCVKMREINPATYIGEGKVEEIAKEIKEIGIDVVVFDQSLTGSQLRNLTEGLGVKVIDRTMLILDIFATRAQSNEGKLQVNLAQLQYGLSRFNDFKNISEHLSGRGSGEKFKNLNRDRIKENIRKLQIEIDKIKKGRQVTRKKRLENVKSVALVGYTNAGKSSLMNLIGKANTYADNKLFATLDVLSRRVWDEGVGYILIDTVGFISNLPHELMHAFSATLEELHDADVVLIVLDASDEHKYEQLKVVEDEMQKQGVDKAKCILVYNKIDKLTEEQIKALNKFDYETFYISCKKCINIDMLKNGIKNKLIAN